MSKCTLRVLIAGLPLLLLPAATLARDAAGDRIPITDPALLGSMGFSPDATNVYATPSALREIAMTPAEHLASQELRRGVEARSPFGTGTSGFSPIVSSSFVPRTSTTEYTINNVDGSRYCVGGSPFFHAQLESIPHGAKLEVVDLWLADSSVETISAFLFEICQPDSGPGFPSFTMLGTTSTSNDVEGDQWVSIGSGDLADIDLQSCAYLLEVRLDDSGVPPCSEGIDLRIQKARAQWRRQVSPASGVPPATFDDVPFDHPFHQHIDALAVSGITSGCGGGNFCPNAPLTRGQMAVFLAKALGLHWGSF